MSLSGFPTFPYSLAYEQNPILLSYGESYTNELLLAWKVFQKSMNIAHKSATSTKFDVSSFLRVPDISAHLLLFITPNTTIESLGISGQFIKEEWQRFSQAGISGMKSTSGNIIPGTNILLCDDRFVASFSRGLAHPDHSKHNVFSLFGDVSEEGWNSLYAKTFAILRKVHPGFYHEIQALITKIVPYGVSHGLHNSCSKEGTIGYIYSSYPTGYDYPEIAILEAIIHEYNHNKIHLIKRTDALISNDKQTIYYSPYRPDARHINGIYLGLHAMVATYYVLLHCFLDNILPRTSPFFRKTVIYILKNQLAINTLQRYGKFTKVGDEVFEDMIGVHKETLKILKDLQLDNDFLSDCKKSVSMHFYQAKQDNPILFY